MKAYRCLGVVGAALAAVALVATAARAQVTSVIPPQSWVVIKVKNVGEVNKKVAALAADWGLNRAVPELADPLESLKAATGIGPGLDKGGDAAFVVVNPPQGPGEPDMLALIPITDFKTFAGTLPNAKPDGAMTVFNPGGKDVYCADWGRYAAISDKKELVANKGTGIQPSPAAAKELESKDLVVYANMKAIGQFALPQFQQMKPKMLEQMTRGIQGAPNVDPSMAKMVSGYMEGVLNLVEEVLTDGEAATLGVTLTREGISTTLLGEFKPQSHLGTTIASIKGSSASFTAGLPATKYLLYGGLAVDPTLAQLIQDLMSPFEKAMATQGDQGKAGAAYMKAIRDYMTAARQMNVGLVAPQVANAQTTGYIQAVSVITGDANKMMDAWKVMAENASAVAAASGAKNMKTTITPNAKTVEGVSLDKFATSMGEPQTPQEQQMAFMMMMFYGKDGPTGYVGKVAPDRLVSVLGGGDGLPALAVPAAVTNADPLAAGVAQAVTAGLPSNRVGALYIQVDQIASLILDIMAAQGVPGGVKLPPNLAPLGFSLGTDGSAVRVDGYLPSPTIKALVAAGMQIYLQRMPGAPRGGGL